MGGLTQQRLVDAGIALTVFAFAFSQFVTRGFGDYHPAPAEPDVLGFLLVVLSAAPLLWRRTALPAALTATMAGGLALVALDYGTHTLLGPAVALYTLAARPERGDVRPLLSVALAGFVALIGLRLADVGLPLELDDYIAQAIVWGGGWLAGDARRLVRERGERERRLVVAEERERIARELHDSAGHAINAILLQAGAARLVQDRDPARARAALETIEAVARETIEDIDRLVGDLRDEAPRGIADVDTLIERHRAAGLSVTARVDGSPRHLPTTVDRTAYRIAQEALINAGRHGEGTAALEIAFGADALELTVTNPAGGNGRPRPGGGRGIVGMRERASLLGGTLEAGPDRRGFRVHARLPYERSAG
jgi:signal transduction histidine kinase